MVIAAFNNVMRKIFKNLEMTGSPCGMQPECRRNENPAQLGSSRFSDAQRNRRKWVCLNLRGRSFSSDIGTGSEEGFSP